LPERRSLSAPVRRRSRDFVADQMSVPPATQSLLPRFCAGALPDGRASAPDRPVGTSYRLARQPLL